MENSGLVATLDKNSTYNILAMSNIDIILLTNRFCVRKLSS